MKKMILGAAALMIGGVAMAQEVTPAVATNQTNYQHANASEVTQGSEYSADYQKARVRQVGLRNSSVITQDGLATSVELGNSADVYQLGADAQAEIAQNGFNNRGAIAQIGGGDPSIDGNKAVLLQGNDDAASSNNIGIIAQGAPGVDDVDFGAEANEAILTQNGTENKASITQLFDRNDAAVNQVGTNNLSTVLQVASEDLSAGMEAVVSQDGADNISVVDQAPDESIAGSDSGRSYAETNQYGDANQALQIQRSTALEGEDGETAIINQGVDGVTSVNAIAIQDQRGAGNNALINQSGTNPTDDGDYAKQRQLGGNNYAEANQDNSTGTASTGNFSFQDQDGWDNVSVNTQLGLANKAQSKQIGNNNTATTTQEGDTNFAHITQMWSNSVATTNQVGGFNHALVNQMEGQSSLINQDGWHNKAAVFQSNGADLPANQTELIFGERYEFTPDVPTLEPVPHLTVTTSPY